MLCCFIVTSKHVQGKKWIVLLYKYHCCCNFRHNTDLFYFFAYTKGIHVVSLSLLNGRCFTVTPEHMLFYCHSWTHVVLLSLLNECCFTVTAWMNIVLLPLLNEYCFTVTPEWMLFYCHGLNECCFTATPEWMLFYCHSWMNIVLLPLLNECCFTVTAWMNVILLPLLNEYCFTVTPELAEHIHNHNEIFLDFSPLQYISVLPTRMMYFLLGICSRSIVGIRLFGVGITL